MDEEKIKESVRTILKEIGEDVDREGIQATPNRVARMYKNLFYGYRKKLVVMDEKTRNGEIGEDVIPVTIFNNAEKEMLIRKVKFQSMCEHHMVTFSGHAYIGIIPDKKLLGMNKIDKIVKFFAARLQIQERLTTQVVDWINTNIEPLGVIVVIKANHLCAELQGDDGDFTTSATRGIFFKEEGVKLSAKDEFMRVADIK